MGSCPDTDIDLKFLYFGIFLKYFSLDVQSFDDMSKKLTLIKLHLYDC